MRSSLLVSALALALAIPAAAEAQEPRVAHQPAEGRPYSAAVQVGDVFWLSGKIGVSPETAAMTEGRAAAETRAIMESFRGLLGELGLGFEDIVQGTVYLTDIDDYAAMNEVYGAYFPSDPPARETVAVRDIVGGAVVEIGFVAVRR